MQTNPINATFIRREKARLPYSVFKPNNSEVFFLKSVFQNRPPVAFFPYPAYVKKQRDSERVRRYKRKDLEYLFMAFKIADNTHVYNALVNSCKSSGIVMLENNNPYFNL